MEKVLKRSEVDVNQTWDLSDIFVSDEKWEEEYSKLSEDINEIEKYKDNILESPENILATLQLDEKLTRRAMKLYIYSHSKGDVDMADSKYQEYNSKMSLLFSELSLKTKFIELKLLTLNEKEVEDIFSREDLKVYKFFIEKLQKGKENTLSDVEEELLSKISRLTNVPSKAFSMLNNADIKFDDVENEKGEKLPLNHARYGVYIESKDRILRKSTYESMYKTYDSLKNTFASTLEGQVLNHVVGSNIKKFGSAREAALKANFVDVKVYDSLLSAVNDKISLLHKYIKFRKDVLKYDDLHFYDLAPSLIDNVDLKFTFEEAKEIIIDALKVLGDEYVSILKKAFDERWIDYAENEGKRSGAYSGGSYDTKPYILISWKGTVNNLFTLAHELGHSIHSYYTRKTQPYVYGFYSIFLAEVASITNELLLNDYLLKKYENNADVKAYLLNEHVDKVRGTLYRQTQFAEFEYEIHDLVEKGSPLTQEILSNKYIEILKKYYGEDIVYDDKIKLEWARVPHFYYNFYVYQYATGISAASAFAKKILEEGKEAVDKYIGYLKAGASDYPLNILNKAGVDMSTNAPVYACLEVFEEKLLELEKTLKN